MDARYCRDAPASGVTAHLSGAIGDMKRASEWTIGRPGTEAVDDQRDMKPTRKDMA